MIGLVPITSYGRVVALSFVDFEDYAEVKRHRWNMRDGYAVTRSFSAVGRNYFNLTISLHRLLCGLKKGDERVVHHRNEIRLDNRRANLMVCADRIEAANQPHPKAWSRITRAALAGYTEESLQAEGI